MDNEYAMVTSVRIDSETNEVYVNAVAGPNREGREHKLMAPAKGMWVIPENGDMVEIYEVERGKRARFPSGPDAAPIPDTLGEGDIAFQLDENTQFIFNKQPDGTYDISITASGDVNIDAEGSVSLGENGARAALEGHTHEFSDADGNDKTTEPPKEVDLSSVTLE